MPQQIAATVENNFTKGLITESTGLNFPENAATDTDNCEYTLIGDVLRRRGINYEINGSTQPTVRGQGAISSYKWNNAGGDGLTQILVEQIGASLYFYRSSSATVSSPLSTQILVSTVSLSNFLIPGNTLDISLECQYTDGNGYLFIFHPNCDPFYCAYSAGVITGATITVQIRDFVGLPETVPSNFRPVTLTNEHLYNLTNQGWTSGNPWSGVTVSSSNTVGTGTKTFTIGTGLTIVNGTNVQIGFGLVGGFNIYPAGQLAMVGTVTSYNSGTGVLVINVYGFDPQFSGNTTSSWWVKPTSIGYLTTWNTAVGNYPSNADVWWYFKDASGVFNPTSTIGNVSLGVSQAPQGHYVINAFNQDRSTAAAIANLTPITTSLRPRTGTWFQGRVWYTGVDAQQQATGDAGYYTWTENIYFSQVVSTPADFGLCYQQNDPTSEQLFDLLPTDGGIIVIQGSGSIYKLFALQNALLVFAANGVWYVTGSQGIGFTANDYTIVKLSSVRSISSTSFINVNGTPMFWNEEGIYSVEAAKQGTSLLNTPLHVNPLEVIPITLGTILTFYSNIPTSSKKYARGDYDPVNYTVQWVYRDTEATDVHGRYTYNKILNFNTSNKAFYPYTVDTSINSINGIRYVDNPGGLNTPDAMFKYIASSATAIGFADEHDEAYKDWSSINYISYFVTGYKLRGQAIKKFQPQYIQVYTRTNGVASSYKIQGIWDFSNDRKSGRWSTEQLITNALTRFDTIFRRHKIRGHGFALQFKITSADGWPFDIQGWAVVDTVNQGT